jgi:hypothetical protein
MILREQALQVALSQRFCEEIPRGSNWGPHVKKYLASVGIGFPAPWCMAGVYWCYAEAASQMGIKNPLVKTGGVLMHYSKARPEIKFQYPQAYDIFFMDFGKGLGHTGFVVKADLKYIYTFEGNGNDGGSREGYKWCERERLRTDPKIRGYLRYP